MGRKIHLRKATRIEGNADIKIEIARGRVQSANFMVHDFRGFERFMSGRRVEFVPQLISRICGLCSASQQVASIRAIEAAIDIEVPDKVAALRRIILLGERISSHALSYFYLSLPDFLGAHGGILELMRTHPEIADEALFLRKAGQQIIQVLGKRSVHPVSMGIGEFLQLPTIEEIRDVRVIALEVKNRTAGLILKLEHKPEPELSITFPADIPVNFLVYNSFDDSHNFQIINRSGEIVYSFAPSEFEDNIGEMRADWSYAKVPYLMEFGFPEGIMLTGPLSRAFAGGGILDDPEVSEFPLAESLNSGTDLSLESYDVCRLLEIFWAAKRICNIIDGMDHGMPEEAITLDRSGYGIGVVEAPRGSLVHSYQLKRGCIDKMRLLVATQFNNAYINLLIKDLATHHLEGGSLTEEGEQLIARCVRIFDPCLSCATH
jgi:coenzyme F420-reducing hydrogenase alpha subunit